MRFPNLFSPYALKGTTFRNRIFSTGHDTYLPEAGLPSDALIAYQVARARGGAGLIVIQVVGVHESARYTDALLMATDDAAFHPSVASSPRSTSMGQRPSSSCSIPVASCSAGRRE